MLRFIPASAGNTRRLSVWGELGSVHPRERGEHTRSSQFRTWAGGSSPRARGTRAVPVGIYRGVRFIPASAGNTRRRRTQKKNAAVHPRERGEHHIAGSTGTDAAGSSPRARGTHGWKPGSVYWVRFIPASAGNTPGRRSPDRMPSVHPRERGEHIVPVHPHGDPRGSTPRARGTPGDRGRGAVVGRFIPASAGNTDY